MKKIMLRALAAGSLLSMHGIAAASLDAPVPITAYITIDGLDWAWASPCSATDPTCAYTDLSYQSQFGWHLPDASEFALHPDTLDFLFPGANVPNGGIDPVSGANFQFGSPGADGACATPYFSDVYLHCDWGDALSGYWWNPSGGNEYFYETLVVRQAVPEPATWAMMLFGFGAAGFALRRSRRRTIAALA